jgi:hypothetical protein
MVIALVGRRIDSPGAAETRFPAENEAQVAEDIRNAFERLGATALVCSAACGADILALEQAGRLGIRRRVVLPFDRSRFRKTSVVDRPGDWGQRYDSVLNDVEERGDEVVLGFEVGDPAAYIGTNDRILDEAEAIAVDLGTSVGALIVWDGKPRSADDVTAQFLTTARSVGLLVNELSTI